MTDVILFHVFRLSQDDPELVDYAGTITTVSLEEAEMLAGLVYHCQGGEYLHVIRDPDQVEA